MKFKWDDERGIVDAEKNVQFLQILQDADRNRIYYGKLIVKLLNKYFEEKENESNSQC